MKTVKSIKSEMDEILAEMKVCEDKKLKGLKAKLAKLKTCLMYMQSEPDIFFVKKEKDRITNRINMTLEKYVPLTGYSEIERKRHKKEYEKSMDVSRLRKQLSTLYYLLK